MVLKSLTGFVMRGFTGSPKLTVTYSGIYHMECSHTEGILVLNIVAVFVLGKGNRVTNTYSCLQWHTHTEWSHTEWMVLLGLY